MSRRAAARLACAGAVLLAGCGGGSSPSTAGVGTPAAPATSRPRSGLDPTLVAALGDSITAGSPRWDPDPAFRVRIANGRRSTRRSQWEYWAGKAHPALRFRNCGVFGERTDEIRARLERCERGARTVVLQGGINDIAQGRSVADAARSLDATVVAAQQDGRRVVLVEVLPWNNGYPDAAPRISALNAAIHDIGTRRHVPVAPWYGALEDPAAKGRMRAALTVDGDHPSVAGYERLAALVPLD